MKSRSALAAQTSGSFSALRSSTSMRLLRARPRTLFTVHEAQVSAGLLLYRFHEDSLEILLAHRGGPLFASKDIWALPKGDVLDDEGPLAAARREFEKSLGVAAPCGPFQDLGCVKLRSGPVVYAWAVQADFDPSAMKSTTSQLEWPPVSGQMQQFPLIDRVAWFDLDRAHHRLCKSHSVFLQRLTNTVR